MRNRKRIDKVNSEWYKSFYRVCWYNNFRILFEVWDLVFNPDWNHIHQYHLVE